MIARFKRDILAFKVKSKFKEINEEGGENQARTVKCKTKTQKQIAKEVCHV